MNCLIKEKFIYSDILISGMEDTPDDVDSSEQNVYKKSSREKLVENDEISAEEEGFMAGYEEDDEEEDEVI